MQSDDNEVLNRLLKQAGPILAGINAKERQLSPAELEELMRMVAETIPPLRELADSEMKTEILRLLPRPISMDEEQIVAALRASRCAPKNAGYSVIHVLLSQLTEEGLLRSDEKTTEPDILEYAITDKGRAQVSAPVASSDDSQASYGHGLRPSPATE